MPDLEITIADRKFLVNCQAGEEPFLHAAAKLLDDEATPLQAKVGRLPEERLLKQTGAADLPVGAQDALASLAHIAAEAEALADRLDAHLT